MIKENLIYPVVKEVDQGMINLHSEDFNITVHVFDEDIIKGISEIKKSIIEASRSRLQPIILTTLINAV